MAQLPPHERLLRKVRNIADLSEAEIDAIRRLPMIVKQVGQDSTIVHEGERPSQCCLLIEGFLFRYKIMPDGLRQIMSLHVPGDIPDLQNLHLGEMDHSLGALEPSTVAFIPHLAILGLIEQYPRVGAALWRETLVDAAIFREWMSNIGRRAAHERAAHLICEFFFKMRAVGLTEGDSCTFPLTQAELGDAMGLSLVHVNRVLQQLRAEGLVVLKGRRLRIPDLEALQSVAQFEPAYLHLGRSEIA